MQTVKGNVKRGYAQALWGKEGQGSTTVASSLLSSPRAGWACAPPVAGCGSSPVPHIPHRHHFYWGDICPRATESVPPFPQLPLPSSILCFCEKERLASVELGQYFVGWQGSTKHFQLPPCKTDFPWEPTQTASKTGSKYVGANISTVPSSPAKEEEHIWKLLCWEKWFSRFYIFWQIN